MVHASRKSGARAALLGAGVNLALSAVKGAAGVLGHSQALVADAVNSLSDVVGSGLVWLGMRWGRKPPDDDHPYGHGRAETLAAACVGVLLAVAAVQIAALGIGALQRPVPEPPAPYTGLFAGLAIVVKEILYRYQMALGRRLASPALIANAHDHRSDVLTSVVALLGILSAQAAAAAGLPWLGRMDAVGSIVVGAIILRVAWTLVRRAFVEVMDAQVSEEELQAYRDAVAAVEGVEAVDDVRVRTYGYYRVLDVKISVGPMLSVDEGHGIAARVKERLMEGDRSGTASVMVHVNPHRPGNSAPGE